jgi:hypothetical protein
LIISTEREPGYYVDYITCALTGTARPLIDQKEWAKNTIAMVDKKQLLLPKQSAGITVDEILEYVQSRQGVDLIIFDYLYLV